MDGAPKHGFIQSRQPVFKSVPMPLGQWSNPAPPMRVDESPDRSVDVGAHGVGAFPSDVGAFPSDGHRGAAKSLESPQQLGPKSFEGLSLSGAAATLGAPVVKEEVRYEVEPMPIHTATTTVRARGSPAAVIDALAGYVKETSSADYRLSKHGKAKMHVVAWEAPYHCHVVVSVFRDGSGANHVEFQRRKGDSFVFHRFYRGALEKCANVLAATSGSISRPRSRMDLEDDFGLDAEAVQPLFDMVNSEYCDVSADGSRCLANTAQSPKNVEFLATYHATIPAIERLVLMEDAERVCCAIFLLANICSLADHRSAFCRVVRLASRVFHHQELEWAETHRQMARAILAFSSDVASLCPDQAFRSALLSGTQSIAVERHIRRETLIPLKALQSKLLME